MKRRTLLTGVGLLATGSGATLTSAAISSDTTPSSTMEFYAAANLVLDGNESSYGTQISDLSKSDLPYAYVNDKTNDSLSIETANLISGSTPTFSDLLRITNNGDTTEKVGFGYNSFGSAVDTGNGGEIAQDAVQDIYTFKTEPTASSTSGSYDDGKKAISPPSGNTKDSPPSTAELSPGETVAIKLAIDPSGYVGDLRTAAPNPSTGSPFTGNPIAGVTLINGIIVGTE